MPWSVLHVEDDPGERRLLATALHRAEPAAKVTNAGSLAEATQVLAAAAPAVVLLDLGLPDSQGLATLAGVLATDPDTPVVVLTGHDDVDGVGVEALRMGAQDFLVKGSFQSSELRRTLRYAVERAWLRRQRQALGRIDSSGRAVGDVGAFLRQVVAEVVRAAPGLGIAVSVEVAGLCASAGGTAPADVDGAIELDLGTSADAVGRLVVWPGRGDRLSSLESSFAERVRDAVAGSLHGLVAASSLSHRNRELWAIYHVAEALQRADDDQGLVEDVVAALTEACTEGPAEIEVRVRDAHAQHGASPGPGGAIEAVVDVAGEPVGQIRVRCGGAPSTWVRLLVERTADLLGTWVAGQQAGEGHQREARRLDFLTDTVPVGVVFVDPDGLLTYVNPEARHVFGVPPEGPIERTFDDPAFHLETVDGCPMDVEDTPFARVSETRAPVRDVVHAIRTPDGQRRLISVNASPILDDSGRFEGMVAAVTDVTEREQRRQELAESQTRLRLLLSQMPAIAWTVDRDLRFTSIDGAGQTALDPVPVVGDDFTSYFGRGGDFLPVAAHRAALDGEPSAYGFWWGGAWWQVAVEPLHDAAGDIVGVIGLGIDGTNEKHAVDDAERQRTRYQALFDRTADAIVLLDDEGRYVDLNPAAAALFGQAPEALVGTSAIDQWDDLPAEQADRLRTARDQLQRNGEATGVLEITADDATRELEYRATAGMLPGVHMAIVRDVTERRRFEQALAVSERQFRSLAEAATEGIYRLKLEPDLAFVYVNPAMERITGLSRDQILVDAALLRDSIRTADIPQLKLSGPVTVRFEHPDGLTRWLEVHQTRLETDDPDSLIVQGILRDVTDVRARQEALEIALRREQDAARELRQLDQLKDAFLQAVSHELRTPLTAVYGLAATIHDTNDQLTTDQMQLLLGRLLANAERLRGLLTDLLDVNRLTKDDITPAVESLDLAVLAREVAEATPLGERTLLHDLNPTPATVEPAITRRLIHNLLTNAERHTPPGTVIRLRTHPDADGNAHLVIEDNGPGFPAALGDTVFEPFVQGPAAAQSPQPGTGIGLNLVRQFVLLHSGTVAAENRPQGGARLHIILPRHADPSSAAVRNGQDEDGSSPRVL